jgi:hypothetical protein
MSVDTKAGVEAIRDSPLEAVAIDLLLLEQLPRRAVSRQVDYRRSRLDSYISGDPVGGRAHEGIFHIEGPHVVRATAEDIADARAAAEPRRHHCLWIAIGGRLCVADCVLWGTAACYQEPFSSDVDLLSDLDGVIDLDAEIANGTFDFGMSEQKLYRS